MIDVAAVLKAWRPGEWQGRCGVSPVHLTFGVWWSEDGAYVSATLGEGGRWQADLQLDGEHSTSGFGDTMAEAVLAMIEQEAFARGEAAERAKAPLDVIEETWVQVNAGDGLFASWLGSLPADFRHASGPLTYTASAWRWQGDRIQLQVVGAVHELGPRDVVFLPALRVKEGA